MKKFIALILFFGLGGICKAAQTTDKISYGTWTSMTVTNLNSLAIDTSDPFAGWQSDRVDNQTTVKAVDFEIQIISSMTATTPANDKAVYVYLIPWIYDGSTWTPAGNFSTTTLPTGTQGTASMSDPNSMKGPIAMPHVIASQPGALYFTVSQLCGGVMPDGWSLAIRNNSGASLGSTGNVVAYRAIYYTNE
jgi:hypothetical protein